LGFVKAIVKHKLVQPILKVVFWAVSILPVNEEEEYFSRYTDARTVMTCAAVQALNKLAVYLSPEELLPFLLQHIQRGLKGTDMNAKKVSCLALVVVVRSCSECVHMEYFVPFLQCICKGITDPAVFPQLVVGR
jgi:hypothetical protein